MVSPVDVTIKSSYDGTDLCLHVWNAPRTVDSGTTDDDDNSDDDAAAAMIIIYHGFLAHGLYPTVRYGAEMLLMSNTNMIIVSADARGHGKSGGLKGYLPSSTVLIQDAIQVLQYAQEQYNTNNKRKVFLWGSSMGGTIALTVANEIQNNTIISSSSSSTSTATVPPSIAGVVLVAPMLKLKVDIVSQYLLTGLSYIIPTVSVIPSSSTNLDKQYRDRTKRNECANDIYTKDNGTTIRVGSAKTCVDLTNLIQTKLSTITVPFLLLIADEDVVIQNDTTLYDVSPSSDKEIKHYPALHGLLCEPEPLYTTIQQDIIQWITKRL